MSIENLVNVCGAFLLLALGVLALVFAVIIFIKVIIRKQDLL